MRKKTPAVRSKEITYRLCKSLKECLSVTASLTCIELQGLPLRERDLASLSKVLSIFCFLTNSSVWRSGRCFLSPCHSKNPIVGVTGISIILLCTRWRGNGRWEAYLWKSGGLCFFHLALIRFSVAYMIFIIVVHFWLNRCFIFLDLIYQLIHKISFFSRLTLIFTW